MLSVRKIKRGHTDRMFVKNIWRSMNIVSKIWQIESELNKITLFQNLLRLAIGACIITLIIEAWLPLGKTYMYTVMVLLNCIIALLIHITGKHERAYHFFLIGLSLGCLIVLLYTGKDYASLNNLFTLGILFAVAFIPNNKQAVLYLFYFVLLQLVLSYRFLLIYNTTASWSEFIYDGIHVVAYGIAIYTISMYFIKYTNKQKEDIELLKSKNTKSEQIKTPLNIDISKFDSITQREKEIALLIGEGLTNKQIGENLFISIETVKTHRKNVKSKLDIKTNKDFFLFALYHNG